MQRVEWMSGGDPPSVPHPYGLGSLRRECDRGLPRPDGVFGWPEDPARRQGRVGSRGPSALRGVPQLRNSLKSSIKLTRSVLWRYGRRIVDRVSRAASAPSRSRPSLTRWPRKSVQSLLTSGGWRRVASRCSGPLSVERTSRRDDAGPSRIRAALPECSQVGRPLHLRLRRARCAL